MRKSCVLLIIGLWGCNGCKGDPTPSPDTGVPDVGVMDVATTDDGAIDADRSDVADLDQGPLMGRRVLLPDQTGVSPDGASDIDTALDAEARAGRITSSDTGFHGLWSHCKQGDFKLYNERIEACISNELSSRYETFAGGGLVDVRVVGQTGADVFDLYTAKIGFNAAHPETVAVVRDGSDGGPAVIRSVGTDMPAAYFVGVAGSQLFTPLELAVSVEYRLAPGDDFIEILTWVSNPTDKPKMVQKGDLIAWGDRAEVYRQDVGFGAAGGSFSWMAAYGAGHAFAWATPDDELISLSASFGDPPWEITQVDAFVLQPGESFAHFGRFFVSDALDPVVRRAREFLGETVPTQRIAHLVDGAGVDLAGRRVEVFDANDISVAGGTTDATGRVFLSIPDGDHRFEVSGVVGGGGLSETVTVSGGELELVAPTTGTLEFDVTTAGAPSPASITVTGPSGTSEGVAWGDRNRVQLMPGTWTVTVARGPEFDAVTQDVTVAAGDVTAVTAVLTRVVDTTDWIAADFHQHMEPSSDSRVWVEDRVLDNAGQGVEVVIPTDHDVVTDLAPVIAAAGLNGVMSTFPGAELSPALAHTNVYPLAWIPEAPGRGTVPLAVLEDGSPRRRTVPELIAAARAMPTDPVVQLNHTRDSSGLFDLVDFDPELGPDAVTHGWFTRDFDAMEVSNGDDCQQFKDWSGLWNAGVEPTPIGSSDSHGLWGDVGSQRTYLWSPGVEVGALTANQLRDIVKAGQVVVATSVMLDFTDGTVPGATLDGSAGSVEIGVRIQSADWVGVNALRVIVNGMQTQLIPITPVDETTDYVGTVSVPVSEDSWVALLASGDATGTYRPSGKLPYAFANAVRVDFDGGGYTAPGVRLLDLDDIPLCN